MGVEKLEEIRKNYFDFNETSREFGSVYLTDLFMIETITTFKDQSDMIAGLQKEIAKIPKEIS